MAIKLIAIDIDGTLINSKREITPRVKTALNAASAQESMSFFVQDAHILV